MYSVKENLRPTNLTGISQEQIDDHWKLYQGYVAQTNKLTPDDRHRYGFEYNGMVLHEKYFENLKASIPFTDGELKKVMLKTWGSFENWTKDFEKAGKTRGIGWAIMYAHAETKALTNHFILNHETGHIAGFTPVLVMDVWEHAYMVDHKAGGRADYIAAFMQNINWQVVEARYNRI